MGEKPPTAVPSQLDQLQALVQQMGGLLQSMQNNLQGGPTGLATTIPTSVGLSGNLQNSGLSTNLQSGGLLNNFPNIPLNSASGGLSNSGPLPVPVGLSISGGMPGNSGLLVSGGMPTSGGLHTGGGMNVNTGMPGSGVLPNNVDLPGSDGLSGSGGLSNSGHPGSLQSGLASGLSDITTLPPRPNPLGAVDPLSSSSENETIKTLANKQQTQQANKLPSQTMGEEPPTAVPSQLDQLQALVQQMGGLLQSMQNNLQGGPTGLATTIPTSVGLSGNLQNSGLSTNLQSGGLLNNFPNIPLNSASGGLSNSGPLPVPVGLSISGGMPGNSGLLVSGGMPTSGGKPDLRKLLVINKGHPIFDESMSELRRQSSGEEED